MAMYEWKETEEEAWVQEFGSNFSIKVWGTVITLTGLFDLFDQWNN